MVAVLILVAVWLSGGCVWVAKKTTAAQLATDTPRSYRVPVKLQLHDGSVVVFRDGVALSSTAISGRGTRVLTDGSGFAVSTLAIDSIAAATVIRRETDGARSLAISVATTAAVLGTLAIMISSAESSNSSGCSCTNCTYTSY